MIHLPWLGVSIKRSLSISDMQYRAGTSLLNNDLLDYNFTYTSFMPNKMTKCLIRLAIYVIIFLYDLIFATE